MEHDKSVRTAGADVLDAVDRERALLAAELHDGLGQTLVSVHLLASMGARLAEARTGSDDPLRDQLERITRLSLEATERVRGMSRSSAPAPGKELGETLGGLAEDLRQRFQVTTSAAVAADPMPPLSSPWRRQAYLAMSDIARHLIEHLTVERIDLYAQRDGEHVELVVSAAGEGLEAGVCLPDGQPMQLAAYRTQLLGGTMRAASAGRRQRITLRLPLP